MEQLGVGVIGVGTFGAWHARYYHEHPAVQLVGVADTDANKATQVAETYNAKAYIRYEELLADPAIQAVSIVVPDPFHREPAVKAAEAGKHILLEKPLATTVEDAKAMLEAADKHGVKLMVDFMNRWNPPFALAKKAIENGELGELLYINMRLNDTIFVPTKMLSWAGQSSVLWFLGSHAIDLVLWLVNDRLDKLSCVSRSRVLKRTGIDTADFYHSVLEFENGVVANIENSWVLPEAGPTAFEFTTEIVGTQGKLDIDTARNGCLIKTAQGAYTYPDLFCVVEVAGQLAGFAHTAIDHFIRCVLDGTDLAIKKEDALVVTDIITKLEEASGRGQAMSL